MTSEQPDGQRPIVSFILTFRDHAQLAAQCLLELFRTASEVASAEFVVIDDGSTEDTSPMEQAVSRLEGLFGIDIQYLRHTKALGYGPSNDEGIRLSCGQYVVLVNSDTLVTRGWLSALLLAFKENARAGIVGPLFMGEKDKVTEAGALIYHAKGDLPVNHNVHCGQNLSFFDSSVRRVDYISAACIMLPRSLYLKVGGFDHQDVDLTLRIRQAGYDIIYQPFAVVYHEPGTTFAPSWSKRRIVRRNQKRFARKWRHLIKASTLGPGAAPEGLALLMLCKGAGLQMPPWKYGLAPAAQLCPWMHNVEVAGNREAYLHIMWMDMELPASQGRLRQLRTLLAAGHAVTVMHRIAGPRASQAAALLRLLGVVVIPGRPASKWELGGNAGCKFDLVLVGSAKMPRAVEQLVAKHCPKAPRMELHSDHLTGPALMQALRLPDLTALPQELRGTCRAKLPDQYKGLQRPSTA
ncbi:hypothetical protein N2152v2_005048 [Parachlorella kessleri]